MHRTRGHNGNGTPRTLETYRDYQGSVVLSIVNSAGNPTTIYLSPDAAKAVAEYLETLTRPDSTTQEQ